VRNGAIRFNRHELAGAFGDLGTDFPLIVSMVLAAGLDSASVLVMFGAMQLFTALTYGLPGAGRGTGPLRLPAPHLLQH